MWCHWSPTYLIVWNFGSGPIRGIKTTKNFLSKKFTNNFQNSTSYRICFVRSSLWRLGHNYFFLYCSLCTLHICNVRTAANEIWIVKISTLASGDFASPPKENPPHLCWGLKLFDPQASLATTYYYKMQQSYGSSRDNSNWGSSKRGSCWEGSSRGSSSSSCKGRNIN